MIKTQRCRDLEEFGSPNLIFEEVALMNEQKTIVPGLDKLKEIANI